MSTALIRNFCIVAHIDHGKSTLADRILVRCGALAERQMHAQVLDSMELERERGITIKAKAVALRYEHGGKEYRLNLIDTPGHVDFSYEVSRSLAACEGALLLVDAAQGVQAQTMANFFLALDGGLEIIPVLNKIDLQAARPEEVMGEMDQVLGIRPEDVLKVSAKTGEGVDAILRAVIERVPPPAGDPGGPLRAIVFDSVYDEFRGVIVFVRLKGGTVRKGQRVFTLGSRQSYEVLDLGKFRPQQESVPVLEAGEVGWLVCNIKTIHDVTIGDTLTHDSTRDGVEPLPGYREPKPMVFCGLYPTSNSDFEPLRKALEKLHLQDSSFTYHPESSEALGFGFRCGFLGLLHMDIVQQRLEREFGLDLVQTAPNVTYEIKSNTGEVILIERPADLPDAMMIGEFREPMVRVSLILPKDAIGVLMKVCEDRRGAFVRQEYLSTERVVLVYDLPLAEILYDFYDLLKSATKGYGTMDYDLLGFRAADLVRMRILVGGEEVDALSSICHRDEAERRGREVLKRLRKEIPRHLFEVALQAAIGGKIVARENIAPLRKNVTSKCYGGDITRKRKLLEKQKEGKKRMKLVGSVEIPQKAFLAVLNAREEDEGGGRKR
ncbi:MAG: elongation factor 4 [Planctomycetaceae bacterium]|nr:translation elongation factor 4 [Planctomycetota bacterium]NUN53236.1 elongation factor 4 [Planctomycetaceae bacterium]